MRMQHVRTHACTLCVSPGAVEVRGVTQVAAPGAELKRRHRHGGYDQHKSSDVRHHLHSDPPVVQHRDAIVTAQLLIASKF